MGAYRRYAGEVGERADEVAAEVAAERQAARQAATRERRSKLQQMMDQPFAYGL